MKVFSTLLLLFINIQVTDSFKIWMNSPKISELNVLKNKNFNKLHNVVSDQRFPAKNMNYLTTSIIAAIAIFVSPFNAHALSDLKVYKNERYHTTISYPSNWEEKKGLLSSDRTVVAFVDPNDIDTSISLAFNPIAADFTRLTSFGGKDNLRLVSCCIHVLLSIAFSTF